MGYAEVAVNSPGSRSAFCYAVPPQLDVDIGQAVWVPFGNRVVQGIVIELSDQPSVEATKEIAGIITDGSLLSPAQVELAQWISERYLSPLFEAIALMLPPGFERRLITCFQPSNFEEDLLSLTPEQRQLLAFVKKERKVSLKELEKKFGISRTRRITEQLLQRHLVARSQEMEEAKVRPKTVRYVRLIATGSEVESEISRSKKTRAYKQVALLEFLCQQAQPVSVAEAKKYINCSSGTIKALENRHLLSTEIVGIRRDPLARFNFQPAPPPVLAPSQQAAWNSVRGLISGGGQPSMSPPVFLLFGVTGSGKTEIYLQALAQVIAAGRRGICLVPEIALTPQAIERFADRFPGRVALLHSGLSLGEQFDEWQWIRGGNCDVVVGPRSALFAPLPDLGLIILDEEHEWTYKQEDKAPRYHARDVALKLAQLSGAAVVLGSATPDIGSFYKARLGEYRLVELKERITPHGYAPLPKVSIVDLREELKAGNTGLFSRSLYLAMKETLEKGEQTILFLNRRGTATFIRCRNCGFVFRCPRCSVALTYHSAEKKLTCHRCGYAMPVPRTCTQCRSPRLGFLGIGTQRVEDEVRRLFPEARVLRWDRDTVTRRRGHEELLRSFRDYKADVLIGTQMVAKGLDLPQTTLAGIISADTGLNFPDFRAGERTFQLLCQVAGRAGRGIKGGKVIIQTYSPDNYAIRAAARHDYVGFYNQEINYRRQYNYPPFSHFLRMVYTHTNNELCQREAERMRRLVIEGKESKNIADLSLIGPVPAFASRVRGRYRWQLIVRGSAPPQALSGIIFPRGWTIDVDPVGIV